MARLLIDLMPLVAAAPFAWFAGRVYGLHRRGRHPDMLGGAIAMAIGAVLCLTQTVVNLATVRTPPWTLWVTSLGTLAVCAGYAAGATWQRRRSGSADA